jgi:L-ribulokinase
MSRIVNGARRQRRLALGLDFGTEEVRAVLVGCNGEGIVGEGQSRYKHGQLTKATARSAVNLSLGEKWALQHPRDWVVSASAAVQGALRAAAADGAGRSPCAGAEVVSVGVDFTSCTMVN